jgi:hypothetical protein
MNVSHWHYYKKHRVILLLKIISDEITKEIKKPHRQWQNIIEINLIFSPY